MDKPTVLSPEDILNLASLKELFGGFAHEIAQPLNAIMIASQVIQFKLDRSFLTEEEKGFLKHRLNIVTGQVQKAIDIIDSLRVFTKGGKSGPSQVSVKQVLEKVHGLMGQQFVGRGIELELNCDEPVTDEGHVSDSSLAENIVVQALAYSRDTVYRLGQFQEHSAECYRKRIQVRLTYPNACPTLSLSWTPVENDAASQEINRTDHLGLQTASMLLSSQGGTVEVSANGVVVTFPGTIQQKGRSNFQR